MKRKAHSLAELIPPMGAEDFENLKTDIIKAGKPVDKPGKVLVPVIVYEGQTLDGLNRERIADELGIDCPFTEFTGSRDAAEDLVLSLNFARRHMTTDDKKQVAANILRRHPERSDRSIGEQVKLDNKTVATLRDELEKKGEIDRNVIRLDTKGRIAANQPKSHEEIPHVSGNTAKLPVSEPEDSPENHLIESDEDDEPDEDIVDENLDLRNIEPVKNFANPGEDLPPLPDMSFLQDRVKGDAPEPITQKNGRWYGIHEHMVYYLTDGEWRSIAKMHTALDPDGNLGLPIESVQATFNALRKKAIVRVEDRRGAKGKQFRIVLQETAISLDEIRKVLEPIIKEFLTVSRQPVSRQIPGLLHRAAGTLVKVLRDWAK